MSQAWRVHVLVFGVACTCALGSNRDACLPRDTKEEDHAVSLLQKNAKKVVAGKLAVKPVPAQNFSNIDERQSTQKAQPAQPAAVESAPQDGRVVVPPVPALVRKVVDKFSSNYEWTLKFSNISLLGACILLVIYEFCVHAGFNLDGLFDQAWAGSWQYYSYGFTQYCAFGVCIPLSEALSASLGYNPTWSGLLMTIMPAMEVIGIEIGRRVVTPFDQSFLCKFIVFGRLWMCASQGMWVIVLLTPTRHYSPSLCFWLLVLCRALLGFGSGVVNTPSTYMAVKWTPKERMKNMTLYAASAKRLGLSFGVITSSLVLEAFNMTKQNSTIEQMAALPVAWCMLYSLVAIVIFDVSCSRNLPVGTPRLVETPRPVDQPVGEEKSQVRIVVPTTEASLSRRAGIVLNCLVYNFTASILRESIDLASTMIFKTYSIGVVASGYLIAAINFSAVVWICLITESMRKGTWLDPAHLLVHYNWACLISGIFFFNFGTWWMFFIADCVCFSLTTAAAGIANGFATNAGIPDTYYSKDSFTAYRAQITAFARLLSGPICRGSVFYFGRNGYAIMLAFFLLVSFYNNWVIRYYFLDESDGSSEETAQMKGATRDGI